MFLTTIVFLSVHIVIYCGFLILHSWDKVGKISILISKIILAYRLFHPLFILILVFILMWQLRWWYSSLIFDDLFQKLKLFKLISIFYFLWRVCYGWHFCYIEFMRFILETFAAGHLFWFNAFTHVHWRLI